MLTTQSAPPSTTSTTRPSVRRLRLHEDARRDQARLLDPPALGHPRRSSTSTGPSTSRRSSSPCYQQIPRAQPDADPDRVLGLRHRRSRRPESGISILANLMGYTVVDVNMRGTGCSGGAYDFFEPLQGLDGYDVIETVANQPWVEGGKVGMFGISFGGISQLFTAQYQPPSLAAITPLSVIDQTQTTLYPGGVLNTGFAYSWAVDRVARRAAGPRRPALGQRPDRGREGRHGQLRLPGQPGAAPRGRRPPPEDRRERPLRPRGRRPALAADLRRQDQRPDLHGLPVDRRADRRPLPDARQRR